MNPSFVKKFDFRGEYNKDITSRDSFYLGYALQKTIPLKKILIGWDTRISSRLLALSFIQSFKDTDVEISYLDKCPIDYVTVGAAAFDFDLSVMFTDSHNPWTWTGLLMHTAGGVSIQGELVTQIIEQYNLVKDLKFTEEQVNLDSFKDFYPEIEKAYAEKLQEIIPMQEIKDMKIAVDLGDGSGSRALTLLEKLLPQVQFVRLHDRNLYDADSSHTADPSELKNMQDVITEVKKGGYAAGFAFDSDADRVLAVDTEGSYLNGSLLGSAQVESLIRLRSADVKFGYAVDCGPSFHNAVVKINAQGEHNLEVKEIPVGRSIVRQMIQDEDLDFGVENVGHFYSKDFFKTDSAVFSIALILYWITHNDSLSLLHVLYPDGQRVQSHTGILEETEIESFSSNINKIFTTEELKKSEVDGVRYEFYRGKDISSWYAVRKSGYEPITKCYFGSLLPDKFEQLESKFQKLPQK